MKTIIIFVFIFNILLAQTPVVSLFFQSPDDRVKQIINSLDPDNELRKGLEKGERGDGIHYSWMDQMKEYGIKQVSFTLKFKWEKGKIIRLRITNIDYYSNYYQYESVIKDNKIHNTGLEKELKDAAISRAEKVLPDLAENVKRHSPSRNDKFGGTLFITLLDDEILPIYERMPYLDK